jgi:hypothetical protein
MNKDEPTANTSSEDWLVEVTSDTSASPELAEAYFNVTSKSRSLELQ